LAGFLRRGLREAGSALARHSRTARFIATSWYATSTPDGWPDDAESWTNTGAVLGRINFASTVAAGRVPGIAPSRARFWNAMRELPDSAQVDGVAAVLLQGEMSPDTRAVLMSGANPLAVSRDGAAGTNGRLRPTLTDLIGVALGSPDSQRR
jgi:hypothetical protein